MRIFINYGRFQIDAQLQLIAGERVAIYGPSGSGKSSILRAIAGLRAGCSEPLAREDVGFLHQNCALFENLNVLQNLQTCSHRGFFAALRAAFVREQISEFHENLLQMAGLSELKDAKISELSGGQKQRAALCAALAQRPKWLLLDEPFSALDDENKRALIALVHDVCAQFGTGLVLISHSAAEVAALCERVILLQNGRVVGESCAQEFARKFAQVSLA